MTQQPELPDLEQQRSRLHADLVAVGDFRRGSLSAVMRRCGKPTCACSDPAHPGHGPQHILIDCGVTPGKTKKGDIGTIKAAPAITPNSCA